MTWTHNLESESDACIAVNITRCGLVGDDNTYHAVFVCGFIGVVLQQRDVPVIVWTAAGGALLIAVMIATTWGRRGRADGPGNIRQQGGWTCLSCLST